MKKIQLFLCLMGLVSGALAVQPDSASVNRSLKRFCFKEGDHFLSFGSGMYGLNNAVQRKHSVLQDFKSTGLPPVFVRYETAISDFIGIGGTFFFHVPSYKWNKTIDMYNYETWTYEPVTFAEKYSGISVGLLGRVNFHFATTKNRDTYVGAGIGYEFYSMKLESDDPLAGDRQPNRPLPVSAELVFGIRNYISDNTALYAEVGYGKMLLNVGLSIALSN